MGAVRGHSSDRVVEARKPTHFESLRSPREWPACGWGNLDESPVDPVGDDADAAWRQGKAEAKGLRHRLLGGPAPKEPLGSGARGAGPVKQFSLLVREHSPRKQVKAAPRAELLQVDPNRPTVGDSDQGEVAGVRKIEANSRTLEAGLAALAVVEAQRGWRNCKTLSDKATQRRPPQHVAPPDALVGDASGTIELIGGEQGQEPFELIDRVE